MALPMDTSAPTYRNIAAAPSTAQRERNASRSAPAAAVEACAGSVACCAAEGGRVSLPRTEAMNRARSAMSAATQRKATSM